MPLNGAVAFLLTCLVGLVGCSRPADGYSGPRGTVAGRLVIDGRPVPRGCQVVFMATRGSFIASGTVEHDGRYSLLYRVAEGLPVGEYVVQVGLPAGWGPAIAGSAGGSQSTDVNEISKAWIAAMPFPERYLAASTSGLEFTVQSGENTADFLLVTGPKRDAAS